ncbi:MAG: hypothetical protein HQK84_07370 [Nitrospinae bacterium]|nr:hypothetical protein [Nitrospinota bacterium]
MNGWVKYLPDNPLYPDNTKLGYSQTPLSFLLGFLFPETYYDIFKNNPLLGVSKEKYGESVFTFGFLLFFFSTLGLLFKTKLQPLWIAVAIIFSLFLMSASTPLWKFWGYLSEIGHWRYPTRAAIVLYFIFSIYAAYGIELILNNRQEFIDKYYGVVSRLLILFNCILIGGVLFIVLFPELTFNLESEVYKKSVFAISSLFIVLLFFTIIYGRFNNPYQDQKPYLKYLVYLLASFFSFLLIVFIGSLDTGNLPNHLVTQFMNISLPTELIHFIGILMFCLVVTLLTKLKVKQSDLILKGAILLMALIFIKKEFPTMELSEPMKKNPSILFERDHEFEAFLDDPELKNYRVLLAEDFKNTLAPHLGFKKSIHNYCCRQFEDNLNFAFEMIAGPIYQEKMKDLIFRDKVYDNLFLKLYNVKYIVDDFSKFPNFVQNNAFKQLSPYVLEVKDTLPLLYFRDDYAYATRSQFIVLILGNLTEDIIKVAFVDDKQIIQKQQKQKNIDTEKLKFIVLKGNTLKPEVIIKESKSGRIKGIVKTAKPGIVVFSEVWTPSWRAYVDGKERDSLPVYGMLQGIDVEPGVHEVRFEYNVFHSWQMKVASLLSIITLLFCSFVFFRHFKSRDCILD